MQKSESELYQKERVQFKDQDFLERFSCIIEITSCEKLHRKKTSWYNMRPLDQIGLVRKLEVVHKQVGGFMILKLSTKWRLYGQWRGYVVTSCRCYVVRYVGIELLGQLKRKTDNHFIFWSHIDCLCSSNTNECFFIASQDQSLPSVRFLAKRESGPTFLLIRKICGRLPPALHKRTVFQHLLN